ncbi:MAG: tRNA pseudouridine(38-40) synthase TruA [Lachnospiraceae bacterium]|nr:tRNA pseudouridine(38-40) synthase TruA [Lachnospiraceae bacterium]
MKRILIRVSYDGTDYHGWQAAEGCGTIAGSINDALKRLTGEDTEVAGTSRTDAGVHAKCNLAVFDTDSSIPPERFSYALNTCLPPDIRILSSEEVSPDYHPRFLKTEKTYTYRIQCGEMPDPLRQRYSWHISFPLDTAKMREAAEFLKGEHDFRSFCSVHTDAKTTVREITDISLSAPAADEILITVKGYGFLYNMVRIITGTLVEVGRGKIPSREIPGILDSRNRENAGPTAPPRGLTLQNIEVLS